MEPNGDVLGSLRACFDEDTEVDDAGQKPIEGSTIALLDSAGNVVAG